MISIHALLFLTGGLQGLILSVLIFFKSRLNTMAKYLLIASISVITIQVILKVISKDWIGNYFSLPGLLAYHIPFLFGPMVYLFVKYTLNQQKHFALKDLSHWLPFALVCTIVVLLVTGGENFLFLQYLVPNNWSRGFLYLFIQSLSILLYSLVSLSLCKKAEDRAWSNHSNPDKIQLLWLKAFIRASAICGLVVSTTLIFMYNLYPHYQEIRYALLVQGVLVYWLSHKVIFQPALFALTESIRSNPDDFVWMPPRTLEISRKYLHNPLSAMDALKIKGKLSCYMDVEKPYLDPDLNLDSLSKMVGEQKHHISRVINEQLHLNFFSFVNGYRVEAAKKFLADPKMNHLTIAGIAFECGFSSVSSFNMVFRKFENVTPSHYKRQNQNRNRVA